jgi:hypothetical protein
VLQTLDDVFTNSGNSDAAQAVAAAEGVGSFSEAWSRWDVPNGELALVERTIGAAYLTRMKGGSQTLSSAYSAVGGNNPQSQSVFKTLDSVWEKVDLAKAMEALGAAAIEA